jgi:predicted outer membrane repeat protein
MRKLILLFVVIANLCFSPTPRSRAQGSPIECTEDALRNAITLGGAATLPEKCVYTLTADLPSVDKSLTIQGNGAIIDGDYAHSIFRVTESANLTLIDLTLQNGFAGSGGAAAAENGDITVEQCRFFNNWATSNGGAVTAYAGNVAITDSVFTGNQAADSDGGALYAARGRVSIERSIFRSNVAGYGGGSLYVGAEMLTVVQSVFADNTADYEGGAVSGYDMTIITSTFYNNSATTHSGGALFSMGQVTLTSSTVTANHAPRGGGIGINDYLIIMPVISQSILVGNEADETGAERVANVNAPLTSKGYNLLGSEQNAEYLAETDIITDQLDFEAFSGEVVPLGQNSLALDAVPVQECATEQDQRGNARPLGTACDIGAVEMEWTPGGELIAISPAESVEAVPMITTQVDCSEDALADALKIGGTLELAANCTYTLTRNLPLITGDITIHGHEATLDGQHEYRILYVPGTVEVALDGITITRVGKNYGAGLYAPRADVTISNSTFLANQISEDHGAVQARNATITDSTFDGNSEGAVQVHDKAVVTRCTFSNNQAEYSDGGGLSASEAIVTDSLFTNNKVGSSVGAASGGGLFGDTLTITGSWFTNNEAVQGGGVSGSDVTIENSVLIENTAQFGGGADAGTLMIINSTFSGNTATQSYFSNPAAGGGASGSDVTIVNSTFSDNQSENVGGAVSTEYGTLTVQQSIIAGNRADRGRDIYVNDWTTFNSHGYNLIGDDNGGNLSIDPTDIVSAEPGLTPFYRDEGVYFLAENSAALDAVPLSDCQTATDQRGIARAQGPACDIGAVEMEHTTEGTLMIPSLTTSEPATTLLDCTETALAEAISAGGVFDLPQNCTIFLTANLPKIEEDLTLYGNGATIDGGTTHRIFYAPIANVTLSNITVQNGIDSGLTAEKGDVTLSYCTFSGNVSEQFGGGVRIDNGRATLSHCTFTDNTTGDAGGGVYIGQGQAIISYCGFFGNRVTKDFSQGGGLWVRDATITNSTIAGNFAYRGGGMQAGTATIVGSTLTDNLAREGSGFRSTGRLNLAQSIISGNSSNSRYMNDIEAGEFISDNYNLIGSTAARLLQTAPNDIVSDYPRLKALPGGVFLLHSDSLAVDAIPVDECMLADDQRGVARPQGNGCDIGATEMEQNSTFVPQIPMPTPTIPAAPQVVTCSQSALSEALSRGGTINMPASCTIMLSMDLPMINRDITINGSHSTIDGGGVFRLLHAPGQAAITLNDLTLQNGRNQLGGAVFSERGDVSIYRCLFTGNEAYTPTDYYFGSGGAVYTGSGQVTVIDSVFDGNHARGYSGGAIYAENGDVQITGSAFVNNSAEFYGGGVLIKGKGSLVITNTTFSHNTAGDDGGALFVWDRPFEITHCTITENTANSKGGGVIGFAIMGTISRSILTGNTAPQYPDFDIYRFVSKGYNILGDGHSGGSDMTLQPTDIKQQDPNLLPLADNIHLLEDDSLALDAIPINECPLSTDQRGVPRPQGSGCDIGAVEMEQGMSPAASATPTPTPGSVFPSAPSPTPTFAAPVGAIECTEAALATALAAGGEINLPLDCAILLSADLPEITADVVINGSGAVIDGKDAYRLFYAPNKVNLTLNQITLQRGKAEDGGAIYAYGGDITLTNCTLVRNEAVIGNGGAVYIYGGRLDIRVSTFTQNYASGAGGAIYTSYGTVTVKDSRIAQNSAASSGGGIASDQGEVTITGSLVTGNTAGGSSGSGGGLWVSGASTTIVNSTFSLNKAVSDGGAILADSLTLISGTITQNVSGRYGGGISIWGQEFILQQSIVADNLSANGMDISASNKGFESRGYNLLSDHANLRQLFLPSDIITARYGLAQPEDGMVVLLEGSPAWDAIPSAECATSIDQRGVVRPQGSGCDIGAVEMGS